MDRTSPSFCSCTSARHASTYLPWLGLGQWMRWRSVRSSPRRSSDSRTEVIAASYAWWRPGILLATTSSSRGTPERRMASPTSASFS